MTTLTDDFAALYCAAVDAGDDPLALFALADWLEDAGDARAAALRRIIIVGYMPGNLFGDGSIWKWRNGGTWAEPDVVLGVAATFCARQHTTRSAAYLALTEVLADGAARP